MSWTIRENVALRRWELLDDDLVYTFEDTRAELLADAAALAETSQDEADVDRGEAERLMQSVEELETTARELFKLAAEEAGS